ncbi:hypothetical protein [Micromonospora coerulea]|uniref:hypothetical protein n=1 Tax=Micromonospora coerulea TaxID=47856 RepID=UPI001908E194|nr:hypothetical protein [Micromonospora veneta]
MVEALCALIGCLLVPYLLVLLAYGPPVARSLSDVVGAIALRPRRSSGLFAALARRHRRAMFVVRESERLRERERDEG